MKNAKRNAKYVRLLSTHVNQVTYEVLQKKIKHIPDMDDPQIKEFIRQIEPQSSEVKGKLCKDITKISDDTSASNNSTNLAIMMGTGVIILMTHNLIFPVCCGGLIIMLKNDSQRSTDKKLMAVQSGIINSMT